LLSASVFSSGEALSLALMNYWTLLKISFQACGDWKFSQAGATLDAFVLLFVFVVFVRTSFDYQSRVGFPFL